MERQQSLIEAQYVEQGPYHRKALKLPFYPARLWYDLAINLLNGSTHDSICLDYGGGDGAMGTIMADRGGKVIIFDPSLTALKYAQEADSRLNLVNGSTNLPIKNNSVDVITMIETLEHIPDNEEVQALAECFRVLKPGGRFVISVPSNNLRLTAKHYRHYGVPELRDKVTSAGFKIADQVLYKDPMKGLSGKKVVGKPFRAAVYLMDWGLRNYLLCHLISAAEEKNASGIILSAVKESPK